MLAAATICDSQGIKNIFFFMGIGYRLPFSHTALLLCPSFSPLLPPVFVRQEVILVVAGQAAVGNKEDI